MSVAARSFLLVNLPYGPFGGHLNRALRRRGAETRHMIFNMGDALSGRGPGGILHRGTLGDWRRRLPGLASDATDLVLFGEGGPYKEAVLDLRRPSGQRLWVLENGYFRPDWITLEQGGANAAGRLPRMAEAYTSLPPELPPYRRTGPALRHLTLNVAFYYGVELLGRPAFPRYRTSFDTSPSRQAMGYAWRYSRRLSGCSDREWEDMARAYSPYFLVCLQRDGDSQLRRHSDLKTNAAFLDAVLDSFARAAPVETRLVVKNHPLDPGVMNFRRMIAEKAAARGLTDRVMFVDGGRLAPLSRMSLGVVVNNSSAGFSALGFGTPVKALGRAVFDFEGLADTQPIDEFWCSPVAPDRELFERFRGHVLSRTQINGSFDAVRSRRQTAEVVADILCGNPPDWWRGDAGTR